MKKSAPPLPPAPADPAAPVAVELAGLRRRFAAMLYESLLLLGILALCYMVPYLITGYVWAWVAPGWLQWIHLYVVIGGYFLWCWRRGGQTLAMQTWRLKLVDATSGRPPGPGQSLLRYTLAWPSLLVGGLGLLWALVDPDRQFLHDRLAGTRIVLLPPLPRGD